MRYLEKAVMNLDYGQYALVEEALQERDFFFQAAPHLTRPLPIILPLYDTFPSVLFYAPYYWLGCVCLFVNCTHCEFLSV
jgi:glycerol-3-phosphate dehydrogenase